MAFNVESVKVQILLQFRSLSAVSYMSLVSLGPEKPSWVENLKTLVLTLVALFVTDMTLVKSLTLFKLQFCHLSKKKGHQWTAICR